MKLVVKRTNPGNLPYLSLYHGTKLYNFLLDTGSTSNWIVPRTAADFIMDDEAEPVGRVINCEHVDGLNATLRTAPRKYTDEDDLVFKFLVSFVSDKLPGLETMNREIDIQIHGILGMEFLQECQTYEFRNNTLTP